MPAHERLDVYQPWRRTGAIEFLALSVELLEAFPRGHATLADQLRRAALSIPLNIAEGVGKNSTDDQSGPPLRPVLRARQRLGDGERSHPGRLPNPEAGRNRYGPTR